MSGRISYRLEGYAPRLVLIRGPRRLRVLDRKAQQAAERHGRSRRLRNVDENPSKPMENRWKSKRNRRVLRVFKAF